MNPLPNLEFLRAFVVTADNRVIKTAAEQLGVSPSAVSQAIAKLETQMGRPLFVKHARPLRLTPAGLRLLEEARVLTSTAETLVERVAGTDLGTQKIRLGLSESVTSSIAPWLIAALIERVGELTTESQLALPLVDRLCRDEIDVMVAPNAVTQEERFLREPLYDEEFLFVCAKNAENEGMSSGTMTEIRPFVGFVQGSTDKINIERILRTLNIHPRKRILVSSSYDMVGLIAMTNGWSLMTPTALWCGRQFMKEVVFSPLPKGHQHARRMWVVGDRHLRRDAVILTAKLVREIFREKMLPELSSAAKGLDGFVSFPEP